MAAKLISFYQSIKFDQIKQERPGEFVISDMIDRPGNIGFSELAPGKTRFHLFLDQENHAIITNLEKTTIFLSIYDVTHPIELDETKQIISKRFVVKFFARRLKDACPIMINLYIDLENRQITLR